MNYLFYVVSVNQNPSGIVWFIIIGCLIFLVFSRLRKHASRGGEGEDMYDANEEMMDDDAYETLYAVTSESEAYDDSYIEDHDENDDNEVDEDNSYEIYDDNSFDTYEDSGSDDFDCSFDD